MDNVAARIVRADTLFYMSEVAQIIAQCGGTATRSDLVGVLSPHGLTRAVRDGVLLRPRRGVYTLPGIADAAEGALRVGGVASHRSAALAHGWGVLHEPKQPEVTVPRHRRVAPGRRRGLHVRWRTLDTEDTDEGATTPLRTVLDCALDLDLPEALGIADSALRRGDVTAEELTAAIQTLPRIGRERAALVLRSASGVAVNPFESGLRGMAIESTGPLWIPQPALTLRSGRPLHPDAGCEELRIALEADSHEYHKSRADVVRDCRRYDEMTLAGWIVLRFAWEHVMFESEWVREVIGWVVGLRRGRSDCRSATA